MHDQSTRFITTGVLMGIAFTLGCIAIQQPVLTNLYFDPTVNATTAEQSFGLFQSCTKSLVQGVSQQSCESTTSTFLDNTFQCDHFTSRFTASRAFAVLSVMLSCVTFLIAMARAVKHFRLSSVVHSAFLVCSLVSSIALLVTFPIILSAYTQSFCGNPPATQNSSEGIGSCGEFFSVIFGISLANQHQYLCKEVITTDRTIAIFCAKSLQNSAWNSPELKQLVGQARRSYERYGDVPLYDEYDERAAVYLAITTYQKNVAGLPVRFVEVTSIRFVPGYGDRPVIEDFELFLQVVREVLFLVKLLCTNIRMLYHFL